jgi:septal ring factor EnvC (AmiA/AmiB activator)
VSERARERESERARERESERARGVRERERVGVEGGVGVETWNAEKGWPVSGSFTTSFSKKVNRRIW